MKVMFVLLAAALQALQVVPPRDTRPALDRPPAIGRAVIRGQVLANNTGRPLARATVSAAASVEGGVHRVSISTNANGTYELLDLPAGRYDVSVSRAGYLDLQYGQKSPRDRAAVLDVREGAVTDLDFRLPRASVVSGRITDELGEPIADVTLVAWLPRRIGPDGVEPMARTDADGEYRLTGMWPGSYVIVARSNDTWTGEAGGDGGRVAYARTYFPGVMTDSAATPVTVREGEEAQNISFSLVSGRLATVSGFALNSRGVPLQLLTLESADRIMFGIVDRTTVRPDGSFEIPNVRPGAYVLGGAYDGELTRVPIEVTGSDLRGLSLTSQPGWSLSGRVIADAAARSRLDLTRVAIRRGDAPTASMRALFVVSGADPGLARPDGDGRFVMTPVFGRTRFHVTLPQGWVLKSATAGDRDLLGVEIDGSPGAVLSGFELVVTDRAGGLAGRVVDGQGTAIPAGTVIVFSEDPARWWSWTGAIRETRPDERGEFRVDGLPAGRYAIVAVDAVETGAWFDHDYLRSILPRSERVLVAEDERVSGVTLRVVR